MVICTKSLLPILWNCTGDELEFVRLGKFLMCPDEYRWNESGESKLSEWVRNRCFFDTFIKKYILRFSNPSLKIAVDVTITEQCSVESTPNSIADRGRSKNSWSASVLELLSSVVLRALLIPLPTGEGVRTGLIEIREYFPKNKNQEEK